MNRVKVWRQNSGLSCSDVDRKLGLASNTTRKYEAMGFVKIPCCDLYQMAQLYKVTDMRFMDAVMRETRALRRLRDI